MFGAVHAPSFDGLSVYGQYGRYPGMFGGSSWQLSDASSGPPNWRNTASRSIAKFTARRAATSSKGGRVVFNVRKRVDRIGEMLDWLGNRVVTSRTWSGATPPQTRSDVPCSTDVRLRVGSCPKVHTI